MGPQLQPVRGGVGVVCGGVGGAVCVGGVGGVVRCVEVLVVRCVGVLVVQCVECSCRVILSVTVSLSLLSR